MWSNDGQVAIYSIIAHFDNVPHLHIMKIFHSGRISIMSAISSLMSNYQFIYFIYFVLAQMMRQELFYMELQNKNGD